MITELETPRLRLRRWRGEDLAAFAALNADPQVMEFFPAPLTREQSDALAGRLGSLLEARGWGMWALDLHGSGFIGFAGLGTPEGLPCSPCVELAWRLARPHWGQGYATEAARHALQFAFGTLGMPQLVSFTATGNLRSRAVMTRLGLRWDGEFFEHPALPPGHPLRQHVLYRVDRPLPRA